MKKGFWVIVILAVAFAAWLIFAQGEREPEQPRNNNNQSEQSDTNQTRSDSTETIAPQITENTWVGMLKASNDKSRGNVMLEVQDSDRIIYINTSRDFSDLYNKDVSVTYEGDVNAFRLIDIQAK